MKRLLRYSARGFSVVSAALLIAFASSGGDAPTTIEWIAFVFFPIGVVAGFALAWWKEAWGAALSLGSLTALYLVLGLSRGKWPQGPYFALFTAPALLFLMLAFWPRLTGAGARE